MSKHFRILCSLLGMAFLMTAQPGKANDFCSAVGGELLQQLSGQWRVSHGVGAFSAAGMMMPYKAPKGSTIDFEHMEDIGVIFATGVDQVGEMLIVPAPADSQALANAAVGADQNGGECEWAQLPVLVGTSNYPNWQQENIDYGPTACQRLQGYAQTFDFLTGGSVLGPLSPYIYSDCPAAPGNTLRDAGMTMTMVVRFASANSASGYLLFDGESDGHDFLAYTPITLSRN